jgi:hypothetical protein
MLAPFRRIELRPQDGGYMVEVLPPFTDGANFDQFHATYKAARGYAGGLRMCMGYPVADLCDEPRG